MRMAVGSDEATRPTAFVMGELSRRGHDVELLTSVDQAAAGR